METTNPSEQKRQQLLDYTLAQLAPHDAVRGVVAVGSVAVGRARPGSDIDAVVFMDPLDHYVCPAEFVWRSADDSYHSIFSDDPSLERDGIQLDLHRLDLNVWRSPNFEWPEPRRAELADGWIAYDPTGEIGRLIKERTAMSATQRLPRPAAAGRLAGATRRTRQHLRVRPTWLCMSAERPGCSPRCRRTGNQQPCASRAASS